MDLYLEYIGDDFRPIVIRRVEGCGAWNEMCSYCEIVLMPLTAVEL